MSELGACRLTDADAPFGTALDSMCSQLASAGVYTNTVLQSTSALLHALCKPEAAALLAAIPQACRDAGRFLAVCFNSVICHVLHAGLLCTAAANCVCPLSCAIWASPSAATVSDSATVYYDITPQRTACVRKLRLTHSMPLVCRSSSSAFTP